MQKTTFLAWTFLCAIFSISNAQECPDLADDTYAFYNYDWSSFTNNTNDDATVPNWTLSESNGAGGTLSIVDVTGQLPQTEGSHQYAFKYVVETSGTSNNNLKFVSDLSCTKTTLSGADATLNISFYLRTDQVYTGANANGDFQFKFSTDKGSFHGGIKRYKVATANTWEKISKAYRFKASEFGTDTFKAKCEFYFGQLPANAIVEVAGVVATLTSGTTLSADQFKSGASVALYPNPVESVLNIDTTENLKSIKVYNTLGQLVKQTSLKRADVSNLAPGFYTVVMQNVFGETVTSNFIKK